MCIASVESSKNVDVVILSVSGISLLYSKYRIGPETLVHDTPVLLSFLIIM